MERPAAGQTDGGLPGADAVPRNPLLTDSETGLPTPLLFRERIDRAWLDLQRAAGVVGLAEIEIRVDGAAAPAAISEARRALAVTVSRTIRGTDSATFVGPDRIWLLLPKAHSLAGARNAVRRLLGALEGPLTWADREHSPTLRAGVTVARPEEGQVEDLIRDAQIARAGAAWAGAQDGVGVVELGPGFVGVAPHGDPGHEDGGEWGAHPDGPCLDCVGQTQPATQDSRDGWDAMVVRRSY
ncbi:MAG: Diguanylate cyclase, GGDEF domain [Chloroflexi bacterium]|nr:MAG: Diguanylate cyclase, GGDEF domain [Chloroflexota bacterium]